MGWRGVGGGLGIVLKCYRFSSRDEESWYEILLNDGYVVRCPVVLLDRL